MNKRHAPGVILRKENKTPKNEGIVGNENIVAELLALEPELMRYARSLTRDYDRANDLLQETNLKVLLHHDSKYKSGNKFKNWTMKIMRNSFLNTIEREEKFTPVCNYDCFYNLPGRNDLAGCSKDIYYAVECLPLEHRKVIKLLMTGHKYDEIAIILNLPAGTVKSRIFYSRALLKTELKDYLD